MAFHRGPKVVTDGLVFYYDTDNNKSYVGEPTTNLIISPTGLINNITTDVPNGLPVSGYLSDGTNYSVHYLNATSTSATGVTFTFSAYMRSRTSPLSTYLFYVYTGTGPDGGWYNLGSGSLTSEWVRYTGSRSDMTGTVSAITIYRYNQLGTIDITGVQLEVKSHVTPFVEGVRSVYQGLYSLVNTNRLTTNLTPTVFDSSGKISLNGSSYISIVYSTLFDFSDAQTITMWMRPGTGAPTQRRNPYNQAYGGSGTLTHEGDGTINYFFGTNGGDNSPYVGINSTFTVTQNETAFIVVTRSQSLNICRWYKNGVLYTDTNAGGYLATNNGSSYIQIGSGYTGQGFIGNIYTTAVYNKFFTTAEVLQNYNAQKSKFGL